MEEVEDIINDSLNVPSEAVKLERVAMNENMPTGLIFGDRYGNNTILDYDTDTDND